MKFAKRVFLVAGIYGFIILLPQYFLEAKIGRDFPPPINHPEYYYGFIGVAVAFQVLFLIVAKDPVRYRAMMIPSIIEKLSFVIAVLFLYLQNRVASLFFGLSIVDLIFGALFAVAYARTNARA
jgi:hypothetical protein